MSANNATLFSGYNFDFLNNSTRLVGSHFKDPLLVSAILVNGICALSFAILLFVAWIMKGKAQMGLLMFSVLYGMLGTMFVYVSPIYPSIQFCSGIFAPKLASTNIREVPFFARRVMKLRTSTNQKCQIPTSRCKS
jgi:hypothetical protein